MAHAESLQVYFVHESDKTAEVRKYFGVIINTPDLLFYFFKIFRKKFVDSDYCYYLCSEILCIRI